MTAEASPLASFEAICLGETMVMVAPAAGGRLSSDSTFVLRAGGAESTVAMYLAAMGHRSAWVSRVGADPLGELLLAQITAAGVDCSLVEVTSTAPTGVYFKDPRPEHTRVFYYRQGSAAATMDGDFGRRIGGVETGLLHLTGITAALSDSCRELIDSLVINAPSGRRRISFDVNYRPSLWATPDGTGRARASRELLRLARAADVVFVGLDEAHSLWGTRTATEVRDLIQVPATLVVKDGATEATAFHGGGRAVAPALRVDVVDPVGAGDAFAAGWLSGALRGLDHVTRLRLGHLVASAALRSVGDYAAPPTAAELSAALGLRPETWRSTSDVA